VVLNGAKRANGMPDFAYLNDHQIASLRHYIRHQATQPQVLQAGTN